MEERERTIFGIFGVVAIALLLLGGGFPTGNAINATDNATIMVTLNTKTMIDISPNNMSFGLMDPGTRSVNYTNIELGASSKTAFQLENIGSSNITYMWLNVTQPTSRPFATGNSANYDAANFVAASINQSPDGSAIALNTMSFIDRIEYNESRELVYLNVPSNTQTYGRLRSGFNEFFWVLFGDTTLCNASSDVGGLDFRIGLSPHNQTQTGTIDFVGGVEDTNWDTVNLAAMYDSGVNANWSYNTNGAGVISLDTPNSRYCVASFIDCSKIRLFRWNSDAPGAGTCGLDGAYAYNSTNNPLYPGDSMAMNIEVRVPFGTAMGAIKTGYLTVIAQNSEGA